MPDEPEMIRQQMHETRSALTEKLETLEQTVVDTVSEAQTAVQETVENVKDAVQETVGVVKESVQEGVQSVRRAFDLPHQMNEYPWLFVGGSVALGYVCGRALQPASHNRRLADQVVQSLAPFHAPQNGHGNGFAETSHGMSRDEPSNPTTGGTEQHSWFDSIAKSFSSEIEKAKALAIGVGIGLVRDMLTQAAPDNLRQQMGEIMNNLTTKLGGETIREPILSQMSEKPSSTLERQVHDSWRAESTRGSSAEASSTRYR